MRNIGLEIVIVLLLLVALTGSLNNMELRAEEPRRAIVAMEMMLSDNYVIPKIHGYNYYNKPPLFNWLLIGSFTITGSFSELSVRLPSLLSFLGTAILIFFTVRHKTGYRFAIIAALLFLFSVDILFYGAVDLGEIDLFLTLLFFVQAYSVYHYGLKKKWWQFFAVSYTLTALGVLTKGIPSIVLQVLLISAWLIYIKQWRKLFSIAHIASALLALAVVSTYFFVYNNLENAEPFVQQLLNESAQRTALKVNWGDIILNILQSPLQLFYIALPATGLLLYLANKNVRRKMRDNLLFRFSLITTVIASVPFLFSSYTANRYLYPVFPFIAIMAALVYYEAIQSGVKRLVNYRAILVIFMLLAVARISYNIWGIPYQEKTSSQLIYRELSAEILHHTGGQPVYLTGFPAELTTDPSLPFVEMKPYRLKMPPALPYQISYYITRETKTIMQYEEVPKQNRFYLTPTDFLKGKNTKVHFTFFDQWIERDIALVTFQ